MNTNPISQFGPGLLRRACIMHLHVVFAYLCLAGCLFAQEEPDDASIAEVVAIVAEHGGIEYARRRGELFADEAEETLQGLPDSAARNALSDAITYVMERRW